MISIIGQKLNVIIYQQTYGLKIGNNPFLIKLSLLQFGIVDQCPESENKTKKDLHYIDSCLTKKKAKQS